MRLQPAHQTQIKSNTCPVQNEYHHCRSYGQQKRVHLLSKKTVLFITNDSSEGNGERRHTSRCQSHRRRKELRRNPVASPKDDYITVPILLYSSSLIYGQNHQNPGRKDNRKRSRSYGLPVIGHEPHEGISRAGKAVIRRVGGIHTDPYPGTFLEGIFIETQKRTDFFRRHIRVGLQLHLVRIIVKIPSVCGEIFRNLLLFHTGKVR